MNILKILKKIVGLTKKEEIINQLKAEIDKYLIQPKYIFKVIKVEAIVVEERVVLNEVVGEGENLTNIRRDKILNHLASKVTFVLKNNKNGIIVLYVRMDESKQYQVGEEYWCTLIKI